jgi:hypothetical protein
MSDLHSLYLALRDVMKTAAPHMKVAKDTLGELTVNVPQDVMAAKDPIWFGSVRLTATNVAYYLPTLITREARDIAIPEALKAKATSKTCFTFQTQDEALFALLSGVTAKAAEAFGAYAK